MTAQTGSADYPVRYSYDTTDGRMTSLKTYRDGDGWNCLLRAMAIGYADASWEQGYIWGLVLGRARLLPSPDFLQSPGGVGGLLIENYKLGTLSIRRLVGYDGNGNVTTLADGANGQLWALYEYDAFGNPTRHHNAIGTHADDNPYRFSTKPMDDETGLVYYGYRYYSPALGRWISRDPIAEIGGVNIIGAANNQLLSKVDFLGLLSPDRQEDINRQHAGESVDCDGNYNISISCRWVRGINPNINANFTAGALAAHKVGGGTPATVCWTDPFPAPETMTSSNVTARPTIGSGGESKKGLSFSEKFFPVALAQAGLDEPFDVIGMF